MGLLWILWDFAFPDRRTAVLESFFCGCRCLLYNHNEPWPSVVQAAHKLPSVQDTNERDVIAASARRVADKPGSSIADSVLSEAWSRGKWLLGLLVLQSMSSVVLDSYQQLLKDHLVVTLFLTMLVGAGGNAGNQSAIKVRVWSVLSAATRTPLPSVQVCIQVEQLSLSACSLHTHTHKPRQCLLAL